MMLIFRIKQDISNLKPITPMQKLKRQTRQFFVFINRVYDLKIPLPTKQVKYLTGKLHIVDQRNNIIATICSRVIKTTYNYLNELFVNLQTCFNVQESCNVIFELVCQYRFRRVVTHEMSILTRVIHLQDIDVKNKYPVYILPYKLLKEERYNAILPIQNMNQNSTNLSLVRSSPERLMNYYTNKKMLLDAKSTLSYIVTQYDLAQLPKNDFININKYIKQGVQPIKFLNSNITYYIKGELINPILATPSDAFITDFQLHIQKDFYQDTIQQIKESAEIKYECFAGYEIQADIDVTSIAIVFNDIVYADLSPLGINIDVLHVSGYKIPGDVYIFQFTDLRHRRQLKAALNEKNSLQVKVLLYYRIVNMQTLIDPSKEQHIVLAYHEIREKRLFDVIFDLDTDIQLQFQATIQALSLNYNNYDEKTQKSLIPLTSIPPYNENGDEWATNTDPKNQLSPLIDDQQNEEIEIEREIQLREAKLQQILMFNREQRIRQIRIQYSGNQSLQPLKKNVRNVRHISCRIFQIIPIGQTIGQNIYFKLIANTQQDESVEAQTCVLNRLTDPSPQQITSMVLSTCGDVTSLTFQVYDIVDENTSFLRGQLNINLDLEQVITSNLAMQQKIGIHRINQITTPDIDEAAVLEKLFQGEFLDLDLYDVYLEGNFSSKGQPIAQVQLQFLLRPVPDDPPQIEVSMTVDKNQNLSVVNQYQQNFLQRHGRIGRLAFAESLPKNQIYQQFVYLQQNTPVVYNLLNGFLVDNNEKLTLLLLNVNEQKLKWFGIKLKAQKQQLNVEYGVYTGIPNDLALQMIYTPSSARERQLQWIKLQFLVYHQKGNLGVINVFVKRQLQSQSLANLVLQVPQFLGMTEIPLVLRYDVATNQINLVSPGYTGKLKKLAQGQVPYKDECVRIYNGKRFLCKSEIRVYNPIQSGTSCVLSLFKDHPQLIKSRYLFIELNLNQELLYEIDDYLTFYSYFFTFTMQLLKTEVCEVTVLSGSYFSIPTFGAQGYLTLPYAQDGLVLAWGGGPQLVQVRTNQKLFCLFTNVQETAVQKIFVKLAKDQIVKTIEFPFMPQIVIEDTSFIQLGKVYQNQNGQWNQELIFNIDCVGEGFVTVTKLIVVGDSWSQVWNLVVSL